VATHLYDYAGYAGVSLGVVSTTIQFIRIRRDGVDGVSLGTWTLFTLTSGFWIAYGSLGSHSLQVVLGSLLVWPFQFYIVGRLTPLQHLGVVAKSVGFSTLFTFGPLAIFGWRGGVYGTGVAMTLMCLPQFVELLRAKHAEGVSAVSWWVGTLMCGLWTYYYAGSHLWSPLVSSIGFGVANLAVALLASLRHVQSRRVTA
jgi:uncharacterized protein with PQ loop repeat